MTLIFSNQTDRRIPKTHLQQIAKKLEAFLKRRGVKSSPLSKEIVLVFLPKKQATALNFKFRSKNYATDVLSFDSGDPACLGELIFCPQVLERQAQEHGYNFKWELTYMFIHGVLHLLGYDHEKSRKEAEKMFELQDSFFNSVSP